MYKINEKILQTPVSAGKLLLLEPSKGQYFEMNETAVLVYQGIENGFSQQQIVESILAQFDVDAEQANVDVVSHIEQMLVQNIVHQT